MTPTSLPTGNPSAAAEIPAATLAEREEALAFVHVRKLKGLYGHLLQYVLVVGGLALFNLWRQPQHLWFLWVAGGWGLGLLAHAARVYHWGPLGPAWEKAQVEKRLGRKL